MLTAKLKQNGVEYKTIQLPENSHELTYGQYLDYELMQTELAAWIDGQMKRGKNFEFQYVTKLAQCVGYIFEIKTEELAQMKYKDMSALDKLWQHMEIVVGTYRTKDNGGQFELDGQTYVIPEITKAYFKGSNNLPEFTYQQLEEIGNAESKLQDAIKSIDEQQKTEKEIKGDSFQKGKKKSQVTFNNTLKKIALCVSDVDEIPIDSTFDVWIEKKMKIFTKISMQDALDTLFFLIGSSSDYRILIELGTILNQLKSENYQAKTQSNTAPELVT